jgi:hypothetical protein
MPGINDHGRIRQNQEAAHRIAGEGKLTRVYVAGPYTNGDPKTNVNLAILQADILIEFGFNPFVPHLSHYQHALYPRHYEDWMRVDLDWVSVAEVVYRLPGESSGADREVALAHKLGIPVVYDIHELLKLREVRDGVHYSRAWKQPTLPGM